MASNGNTWSTLASTLRNLSQLLPGQSDPTGEADLYYRRACLAAAEERYDVALVFCTKAVEVAPRHLASRLLLAKIYDRGLGNLEAAVAGVPQGHRSRGLRRRERPVRRGPRGARPARPQGRARQRLARPARPLSLDLLRPRHPRVPPRVLRRATPDDGPIAPGPRDRITRQVDPPVPVGHERVASEALNVDRQQDPADARRTRGLDRTRFSPARRNDAIS